jgi:hypothetical protein
MPKANVKFKERDVRRAIRAVVKEGIAFGRVAIDPDGNIVVAARSETDDNEKKMISMGTKPYGDNQTCARAEEQDAPRCTGV